jgi:hypothetical protein
MLKFCKKLKHKLDRKREFNKLIIRHVSLFWTEKIEIIIDYFQIFGLLWIISNPWPWPYIWITWTRWIVLFNLDIFSMTKKGFFNSNKYRNLILNFVGALAGQTSNIAISKWGEYNGYIYYALVYVLVLFVVAFILYSLRLRSFKYGKKWNKYRPYLILLGFILSYLYYAPVTLTVFRLYYCTNSYYLSADPSMSCSDPLFIGLAFLCSLCFWPFFVLFPYQVYKHIEDLTIYEMSVDHEKRIQAWELFHMLGELPLPSVKELYFLSIKSIPYPPPTVTIMIARSAI